MIASKVIKSGWEWAMAESAGKVEACKKMTNKQ
jgi:hypothetical protein